VECHPVVATLRYRRLPDQAALRMPRLMAPHSWWRPSSRTVQSTQCLHSGAPATLILYRHWCGWQTGAGAAALAWAGLYTTSPQPHVSCVAICSANGRAVLSQSAVLCLIPSEQVAERDLYLAWSLKRSKAVNGTSRVVGVIGKGHLQVRERRPATLRVVALQLLHCWLGRAGRLVELPRVDRYLTSLVRWHKGFNLSLAPPPTYIPSMQGRGVCAAA
jgi:hypothetical protein